DALTVGAQLGRDVLSVVRERAHARGEAVELRIDAGGRLERGHGGAREQSGPALAVDWRKRLGGAERRAAQQLGMPQELAPRDELGALFGAEAGIVDLA